MIKSRLKQAILRLQTAYRQRTAKIHPDSIPILGHQKSGTTVIAALLAEISNKSVTIDPFHHIDLKAKLRTKLFQNEITLEQILQQRKLYFSTPLIKDPSFTFFYPSLSACFPEAKYIFVMRDPRDTIRSVLNRLKIPGNLPNLQPDSWNQLASMDAKGWLFMLQGHLPEVPGKSYIERLAHRWNLAAETYLMHKDAMVLVRYEDFLQDKVGTIQSLAQAVGLKATGDIADRVNIQYQPRGDRNINWLDFFGAENLTKIEEICQEKMQIFKYISSSVNPN